MFDQKTSNVRASYVLFVRLFHLESEGRESRSTHECGNRYNLPKPALRGLENPSIRVIYLRIAFFAKAEKVLGFTLICQCNSDWPRDFSRLLYT